MVEAERESTSNGPSARRIGHLRWWIRVVRHPSAILLLVQLAGILLYPLIENGPRGHAWFAMFGVLVLCLTIAMVHRTAGQVWISLSLAIPTVALNVAQSFFANPALLAWAASLEALFYFYAAGALIAYMLADRRATTDELFAAGATFTLLAWAFAFLFVACQAMQPEGFGGSAAAPRSWSELMFLSFVLLSSTGIGDVVPVSGMARAVASLEIFTGVMYLALVVSRLIGLTLLERDRR